MSAMRVADFLSPTMKGLRFEYILCADGTIEHGGVVSPVGKLEAEQGFIVVFDEGGQVIARGKPEPIYKTAQDIELEKARAKVEHLEAELAKAAQDFRRESVLRAAAGERVVELQHVLRKVREDVVRQGMQSAGTLAAANARRIKAEGQAAAAEQRVAELMKEADARQAGAEESAGEAS